MNTIEKAYSNLYIKSNLDKAYPNEYVIRIFLGNYPNLNLQMSYENKKVLDLGMGDGRNLKFLCNLGFDGYGTEITEDIINHVENQFLSTKYRPILKVGLANKIPFENDFFDFLLSWNSAYYMGYEKKHYLIENHISEIARVLKPNGILILSVPQLSDSIYQNSKELKYGYRKIIKDYYNTRNNIVMAYFNSKTHLKNLLSPYFEQFSFGMTTDDCFGYNYHSYLVVCRKNDS